MTWREEQIGDARLILGDCREILPTLEPIDLVVTSPPYAQQRNYISFVGDDYESLIGVVSQTPSNAETQVLVNLGLVHRDGFVIEYWEPLKRDMAKYGWRFFGWYVWDQMSGMAGDWNGRLAPSFEFVFHFNRQARTINKTKPTKCGVVHGPGLRAKDGSAKKRQHHDGRPTQPFKIPDSVIRTTRETEGGTFAAEHPARFPVRFANELVAPFSNEREMVCDPFMGSGTTGVACAKLGRKFIGIEIEPKYFDIACKRIDDAYKQGDMFVPRPAPPEQKALI